MRISRDNVLNYFLMPLIILLVCVFSDIYYFINKRSIFHCLSVGTTPLIYMKMKIQDFKSFHFFPGYSNWINTIYTGGPLNSGLSLYNPLLIAVSYFKNFSDSLIAYDILLKFIGGLGIFLLLRNYNYSRPIALFSSLFYPLNPFTAAIGQDPQFASVIFLLPWVMLVIELIIENKKGLINNFILSVILSLVLSLCFLTSNLQSFMFLFCFVIFPYVFLRLFVFRDSGGQSGNKDSKTKPGKPVPVILFVALAAALNLLMVLFEIVPLLNLMKIGNRGMGQWEIFRIFGYSFSLTLLVIFLKKVLNSDKKYVYRIFAFFIILALTFSMGKNSLNYLFIANYFCRIPETAMVMAQQPIRYFITLMQLFLFAFILIKRRLPAEKKTTLLYLLFSYFILNIALKTFKLDDAIPAYYWRYSFIVFPGLIVGLAQGFEVLKSVMDKKYFRHIFIFLLMFLIAESYYVYLNRTLFTKGFGYIERKSKEYDFLKNMKPAERMVDVYDYELDGWGKTFYPASLPKWLMPSHFGANTFSTVGINIIPLKNAEYKDIVMPFHLGLDGSKPLSPLLDLAGVKYVFSYKRIENGDSLKLLEKGDEYYIYLNTRALPRIMLIPQAEYLPKSNILSALSKRTGKDFLKSVIIDENENKITFSNSGGNKIVFSDDSEFVSNLGSVKIIKYENNYVEIECKIKQECLFMLTDTFYKGWKAYIDEREADIIRCDYIFRGIKFYPGNYDMIMKYEPREDRISLNISLFVFIAVIFSLIILIFFRQKDQ